jgi:hypothetical protein
VPRQRLRPVRRQAEAPPPSSSSSSAPQPTAARPVKTKPQWRETIDSFGGFLTIGAIIGAIVIVGAIFISSRPNSTTTSRDVSTSPLMGTAVPASDEATDRQHVSDPSQLRIPDGEPPTRGPHFVVPQSVGVYNQPVPDGNAIHALEHGIVWISYHPDKVEKDAISQLGEIGKW